MIERAYDKFCITGKLSSELIADGLPIYPSTGARFYSIRCEQQPTKWVTTILLFNDITQQEIDDIDAIVAAHIPTPLPVIEPPTDEDGKPYVRNEVRPLGQGAYFSSAGDDAVLGIGNGKRIDWDFSNTEDQTIIDEDYKTKIIDVQFKDPVYVRGGFLTYRNSQDECIIDMGVICPSGQYYLNSSGVPTLAPADVWVSRYVNKFDMDGDNTGIYIDGGTASTAIPVNYKMRFQITTKTADVSSRGHVAMMLYRSRTVDLPS